MDSVEINNPLNNTKDTIPINIKAENNFYEFLTYIFIYISIGFGGFLIKYIQEKLSAKKVFK